MSKSTVKKYLKSLDKEALEQLLLDMYAARKEAKEFLEYVVNPDDKAKFEEYKKIIAKEFSTLYRKPKMRFSVCKAAVRDFVSLDPDPALVADLMLCIPEYASKIIYPRRYPGEAFLKSCVNSFKAAMEYITSHGLSSHFKKRIDELLKHCASSTPWEFNAAMWDVNRQFSRRESEK